MIGKTAAWTASLTGWRRYGLAFLLGGVATLALPPVYAFPLLFAVFPPLLWMLEATKRKRESFAVGWWFGFGYFIFGLYWIGNALLVFAAKFAWMLPFASAGLPAFLAVFCGTATLAARYAHSPLGRAILFAVAWTAVEWIRGHALTGFPWNLIGYAWAGSDGMIQLAALVGIYGVGFAVVLSACLPAALATASGPRRIAIAALAIPVVAWTGGTARLATVDGVRYVDGVGLRIVQSDIPQREKWAREFQERNLRQFLDLSLRDRPDWVTHVIWPETAATFFLDDDPGRRRTLAAAAPPDGLLLTGAPRRVARRGGVANAMLAIADSGRIVARYDKFHLVPFGEYVPFAGILPIDKITHGRTGFTPGYGVQSLALPGLPVLSPLICYEVIFPGEVALASARPEWLLNLTNDAWYGVSAGPHQHLAQARVRAVEEGLPLVRAAYTGISAVVDPYGRVLASRGLYEAGWIDSRLPRALAEQPLYVEFGEFSLLATLLLSIVILLLAERNFHQLKEQ